MTSQRDERLRVDAYLIPPAPPFPNDPKLPLLVYSRAVPGGGPEDLERLFESNGWTGTWRNGVYPYHHYHSNAHEVLGVCSGSAEIQFGGPSGPVFSIRGGDVVVLPAGTAHRRVESSEDFLVVGAYPAGQENYDLIRGEPEKQSDAEKRIAAVGLPKSDPVYGTDGPLLEHWSRAGRQ